MNIIKSLLIVGVGLLVLGGFAIFISKAKADIYRLDEVSTEYKSFFDGAHNPLITDNGVTNRPLKHEWNLNINNTFYERIFSNVQIHSYADDQQFRLIGLKYDLGLHVISFFDIYYEHLSEHLLDANLPYHWPVENSIGIKIYLYKGKHKEITP